MRHCATSRKVAGSIPDGFNGIFHWHNPSGRTMALGSTQPLTEMSTRNISWWQRRPLPRVDNLTTFMCRLSWNLGASTCWNPLGLSRPLMGLLYLYLCLLRVYVCMWTMSVHKFLGLHKSDHRQIIGRGSVGWILLLFFIQSSDVLSECNYLF